jgi:branched-chain amino acid transport system permease protein
MNTLSAKLLDAAIAAGISLVLAVPFVGVDVFANNGVLAVATHWERMGLTVAVVFVGRLLYRLWHGSQLLKVKIKPIELTPYRKLAPKLALVALAIAILLPFMPLGTSYRYILDTATAVLIYVMLGWGLNIVVGLAGLLDLGYVAFYAIGAYSYALLSSYFGLGFWTCLPLSGLFAAAFGVALGLPVLRLRGDYLAIVTLGFGEMIRIILTNWTSLTGGPNGISGIPKPTFFNLVFARTSTDGAPSFADFFGLAYSPNQRVGYLYLIILALALLTNFLVGRLRRLPIGRAWEALREDEIACRSLGVNPTLVKLSAFGLGAMLGGFAGAFFATRQGFVSPESFVFAESAIILAIVVLGGMGSQVGVVIAAAVLVLIPELGRAFSDFRLVAFGAAMVLIMVWRPQGLISFRAPTVLLGKPQASP